MQLLEDNQKAEIVQATDQVTHNNHSWRTLSSRMSEAREGIAHIVCLRGSPVHRGEHIQVQLKKGAIKKSAEVLPYYSVSGAKASLHTSTMLKTWLEHRGRGNTRSGHVDKLHCLCLVLNETDGLSRRKSYSFTTQKKQCVRVFVHFLLFY